MRDTSVKFEKLPERGFAATVAFAILALLLAGYGQLCLAQQPGKQIFPSAEDASQALYLAVQNDNEEAMTTILGAGKQLIFSDDNVHKLDRDNFAGNIRKCPLGTGTDTITLCTSARELAFPIPLVSKNGAWNRCNGRYGVSIVPAIGENEVTAIEACHALVVAKKENQRLKRDTSTQAIRALLVHAGNDGPMVPFHGYYFRILISQGKNVTSSAASQISDRKTPGSSFVFVAYPAEYRSTGVMTYLVNQDDIVYEKDLGANTVQVAEGMTEYNPDSTWHPAE